MSHHTKTLFLTGGLDQETKLLRIQKAVHDKDITDIHIVGQDFGDFQKQDGCGGSSSSSGRAILISLSALLYVSGRKWNTVKLLSCRGRTDLLVESLLEQAHIARLVVSPPNEIQQHLLFPAIGRGLGRKQAKASLQALCLHDMSNLTEDNMLHLVKGLRGAAGKDGHLGELSFNQSTFTQGAVDVLALELRSFSTLQHLSLQNSKLTDEQCESIVLAISRKTNCIYNTEVAAESPRITRRVRELLKTLPTVTDVPSIPSGIMELCLDGNQCHRRGTNALARLVSAKHNNLLVLDVASQKFDGPQQTMDLTEFATALANPNCRICGLQLSDNRITEDSLIALSAALASNTSVKILHMAWCPFTPAACKVVGESLRSNKTMSKFVLYECKMTDACLSNLSQGLCDNTSLKRIDLGGKQSFTAKGLESFERALQLNETIEYVSIRDPHQRGVATASTVQEATSAGQSVLAIEFQCDLNRGGKRFLRTSMAEKASVESQAQEKPSTVDQNTNCKDNSTTLKPPATPALWPFVLERARSMELPSMRDPFGGSMPQESLLSAYRRRMSCIKNKSEDDERRKASVLFHLLRNGTALH